MIQRSTGYKVSCGGGANLTVTCKDLVALLTARAGCSTCVRITRREDFTEKDQVSKHTRNYVEAKISESKAIMLLSVEID